MKLIKYRFDTIASLVLGCTISTLSLVPQAQATAALKRQNLAPIASYGLENSTCYIQLPGRDSQSLDYLCGTHEPKRDRRRDRNELDTDGLPFLMKENFRATEEASRKLQEAHQRFEREMPLSDNALQLKDQQQKLWAQMNNAKTQSEQESLLKQARELSIKLDADPSVKKSYEMMRKLFQRKLSR